MRSKRRATFAGTSKSIRSNCDRRLLSLDGLQLSPLYAALDEAGRDPATVVHHCGSGVSAVPNLLAMEIAGLGRTALFAGSWSEWCSDRTRPMARA